jgi:transcriptional regulator with XRE-family HTH domain
LPRPNKSLLEALGDTIAERRLSMNLSQQELAAASGIQRSYLSDVERGLRNITLNSLEHIASALDSDSGQLLASAHKRLKSYRQA